MSPDLRLIPHTAKADADVFFIQRLYNAACNRGFTGSGRSYQTDNRAFSLLGQRAHRQKFQHTLLYLFQTIMIPVKNLLRASQVGGFAGSLVPRKLQKCLDVGTFHTGLCTVCGKPFESGDFFCDLFLYFFRGFKLLQLFFIQCCIRRIVLPQLLLNIFQLFPQNVIFLVFIHTFPHFFRQIRADSGNLYLRRKHLCQRFETAFEIHLLQNFLLYGVICRNIFDNLIHQLTRIVNFLHMAQKRPSRSGIIFAIFCETIARAAQHRFFPAFVHCRHFQHLDVATEPFPLSKKRPKTSSANALYENANQIVRQLRDLFYLCNTADLVQILCLRVLRLSMALGYQKYLLIFAHRLFCRQNGLLADQVKMYHRIRQDRHAAQGDHRKFFEIFHRMLSPIDAEFRIKSCGVFFIVWKRSFLYDKNAVRICRGRRLLLSFYFASLKPSRSPCFSRRTTIGFPVPSTASFVITHCVMLGSEGI